MYPNFNNHYKKLYESRLSTIRKFIKSDYKICDSILEMEDSCIIIGILFVSSDLKETIFDVLEKDGKKLKKEKSKLTYYSSDVKYFLEDYSGKIELVISRELLDKYFLLSTGMCLGFKGSMVSSKFVVDDVIFPESFSSSHKGCGKVAFVSGISLDKENRNRESLKIIFDYLSITGIRDAVIVGNFFASDFIIFKKFVESLSCTLILIPECGDFGSTTYPIAPLHRKLFDTNIRSEANPAFIDLCNSRFAVCSSLILEDLLRYRTQDIKDIQHESDNYRMHLIEEKINDVHPENYFNNPKNIFEAIKVLLKCRHLCPNAPDTIPTVPYEGEDIFFIKDPIDFLFISNTNEFFFEKDADTNCLIFGIPNFNSSKSIVLLDLEKMDYELIKLK